MTKLRTRIATAALLAVIAIANHAAYANNEMPGAVQTKPVALVGGKIFTVSHGVIENGTIIFDNGKITAIGSDITIPSNAEVIDVKGKYIYPGLIAPNTTLGIVEIDAVRATQDYQEVGMINPDVRGDVAYNPDTEISPTVRTNGVTTAEITPQAGYISGTSSLMNLDGWTREDMDVVPALGVHVHWPSTAVFASDSKDVDKQKKEIEKNVNELIHAIHAAKSYYLAHKADSTIPKDARWQAMLPVFDGTEPLFMHADEVRQIESAIEFCTREHLRMILVGGREAWRIAPMIKEHNIPVVLDRVDAAPVMVEEDYDAGYALPSKLRDAGIPFCLSDDGSWPQRNLPFQAATSVGFGLTEDEALRAVTLSTAEIFGVANRLGSLDVGKDANIVVSTSDLLDIGTNNVVLEYIGGRKVDLDNKQKDLYKKYEEKYSRSK